MKYERPEMNISVFKTEYVTANGATATQAPMGASIIANRNLGAAKAEAENRYKQMYTVVEFN